MRVRELRAAAVERVGSVRRFDFLESTTSFRADVIAGLSLAQKAIPPKYFYDARGSELFEAICDLPEYYPTRTELAIMRESVREMAAFIGQDGVLIELGSGASVKTCILIEHALPAVYVPIEISESALEGATSSLRIRYPWLDIVAIRADFAKPLTLPDLPDLRGRRRVAYFPGSTIGNFTPEDARAFLRVTRELVGPSGALLIGVDTKKDKAVLDAAYDDAQGVTAEFNINLLARMNRELGADFDVPSFRHKAFYDPARGRIEMHLESLREQQARIGVHRFSFRAGETIHTEISCKYSPEEFVALAEASGFQAGKAWFDPQRMFGVYAMSAR